jgi:hypothetical protein
MGFTRIRWGPEASPLARVSRTPPSRLPARGAFVALADTLESTLEKHGETEFLWLPTLPRIRFARVPRMLGCTVRDLEAACAILCERHRTELGVYRDDTGALWLVKGSPKGVTAPLAALGADATFDLVFHTHPVTDAKPSQGDLDILAGDRDRRGAVVSITGQKTDYYVAPTQDGASRADEVIGRETPVFAGDLSERAKAEQLDVHLFAAVQEDFRAAQAYLTTPAAKNEAGIRPLTLRCYEQALATIDGKRQPLHKAIEPRLAKQIGAEIAALKKTLPES